MKANLDDALRLAGRPSEYQVIDLETLPDGDARRGDPTPTVLVSNRDLFRDGGAPAAFPGADVTDPTALNLAVKSAVRSAE